MKQNNKIKPVTPEDMVKALLQANEEKNVLINLLLDENRELRNLIKREDPDN